MHPQQSYELLFVSTVDVGDGDVLSAVADKLTVGRVASPSGAVGAGNTVSTATRVGDEAFCIASGIDDGSAAAMASDSTTTGLDSVITDS